MTDRKATKRRLERAGYVYRSGWLPLSNPAVRRFGQQIEMHREDVERIASEPPKPRGRPRKA